MTGVLLRSGAATDVGRLRTINQDRFVLLPDRDLFIVADGMGGHQGGEVASQLAVETLRVAYQDATADALTEAIAAANDRIRNEGDADPDLRGMGTTVVALALMPEEPDPDGPFDDDAEAPQHLLIANVGDSRGYLFRDGSLTQLTEDHSVVADLVREGSISPEEAEVHPQRNIVTRVLGVYETVEVDLWPVDPIGNDRYLLCSDGLFNEVGADQIGSVLRRLGDPNEAASELVRLANEGGGRDNITVVIVDVVDDGDVAEAASTALPTVDPGESLSEDALDSARTGRPSLRQRRAEKRARRSQRTQLTWRALLFSVLVLAVIGGAVATIQWYGTSTYFVGFEGDEVVIFKGRPGGLLWIDPTVKEPTGIDRADVPAPALPRIKAGVEQSSLAKAKRFVANLEDQIDEGGGTGPTTSTTRSTTTADTTPTQAN